MGSRRLQSLLLAIFVCVSVYCQNCWLWGTTYNSGTSTGGTIFKIRSDGSGFTKLYNFNALSGSQSMSELLMFNGSFYGTTYLAGANSQGVIFKYDTTSNIYSTIIDFNGSNGWYGDCALIKGLNNKLYSTTKRGGVTLGNIFSFSPNTNNLTTIHNFIASGDGAFPVGTLCQATDGLFYGMSDSYGPGAPGVLFSIDSLGLNFLAKHSFTAQTGIKPSGHLIQASDGNLYGLLNSGGANFQGVLFRFNIATNTFTKLFDFSNTTGYNPKGSLIQATDGQLYGLTSTGGAFNAGTIFRYNLTSNTFTVLIHFDGTKGVYPEGSLTVGCDGKLYGMASGGGSNNDGTIFSYDITSNFFQKIFDFSDTLTGKNPTGTLVDLKGLAVSVNELTHTKRANCYPNPSSGVFIITVDNPANTIVKLKVYNEIGILLLEKNTFGSEYLVNLNEYPTGFYNIIVCSDVRCSVFPVIKE